jgi:hypothetical protein
VVDIHELKNVEDLDQQTITYLLPFVYVGEAEIKESTLPPDKWLKYSRQELMLRTNFTLQEKAGYADKKYLGDPYYLSFRYDFNAQDKIRLGISGEKDPGEPVWNAYTKGFDYYTFNLTFKKIGIIDELHIGNYRLSFGQGLVMNTNFSMGKTADVININQKNAGIQRHISTNESQYFSGIAAGLHRNNLRLLLFYSYRNPDANADDTTIYTFKTDGYHRTYNDLLKRRTAQVTTSGMNLQWQKNAFSLGFSGVYYSFGEKILNPEEKPYTAFYLRGKNHLNAGLTYGYHTKKGNFQGETAIDNSGKIATVNNLQLQPVSFMDWVFSFRYYDKQYNALYGKGFSESTGIQNETGFYTGTKIRMFRRWELSAYLDLFIFPWLKYGINTPSSGEDVLVQLKYNLRSNLHINLRYKYKEKQANTALYQQNKWRYQMDYTLNKAWNFKEQIDYILYKNEGKKQQAWSWIQSVEFAPEKSNFQIDGGFAYFHTGDWNTRISVYEKNILYAFSFPTYYGQGLRYYATFKWKIIKPLTIYFKWGSTHYFDRETISSGLEEIQGKEKTDVYCLLKYVF